MTTNLLKFEDFESLIKDLNNQLGTEFIDKFRTQRKKLKGKDRKPNSGYLLKFEGNEINMKFENLLKGETTTKLLV